MQHRRFAHASRDFEYALQTEKVAHEMLRAEFVDEGGPGRAPLTSLVSFTVAVARCRRSYEKGWKRTACRI